ncbi:hypothetical protein GO986_18100 [Deinococcus sp. HMF7620]|uniref:Lipoprotein n=1 Tax=Deinococcus arboris TaxID=2682977 RepID=A0A7C9HTM2_9DEIO|nr:hypothetical protein [Deinococcus arboris]MVN88652.1 hypothetical protein [Deinococcus arboris]
MNKSLLSALVLTGLLSACGSTTPATVHSAGTLLGDGATGQVLALGSTGIHIFSGLTAPGPDFKAPSGLGQHDYYLNTTTATLYRSNGQTLEVFTKLTHPQASGAGPAQVFYSDQLPTSTGFVKPARAKAGDYQLDTQSGNYYYFNGSQYQLVTSLTLGQGSAATIYSAPWINIHEQPSLSLTGGRPYVQSNYACILRVSVFDTGITQDVLDRGGFLVYGATPEGKVVQFNYTNYNYGTAAPGDYYGQPGTFPSASGEGGFYNAELGVLNLYYYNPSFYTACQTPSAVTQYPKVRYVVLTGTN